MGMRAGIWWVAFVLKWAAIVWLVAGLDALVTGLSSGLASASELLLLDGLVFGMPSVIGLILAYIFGGFDTSDAPTQT
jgi:hypothetical protein